MSLNQITDTTTAAEAHAILTAENVVVLSVRLVPQAWIVTVAFAPLSAGVGYVGSVTVAAPTVNEALCAAAHRLFGEG